VALLKPDVSVFQHAVGWLLVGVQLDCAGFYNDTQQQFATRILLPFLNGTLDTPRPEPSVPSPTVVSTTPLPRISVASSGNRFTWPNGSTFFMHGINAMGRDQFYQSDPSLMDAIFKHVSKHVSFRTISAFVPLTLLSALSSHKILNDGLTRLGV
jgi:hypothetical protein